MYSMNQIKTPLQFWLLFFSFALLIFFKVTWYEWNIAHSLLISSIITHPTDFYAFWTPKIVIALFFASIMLISKRLWWTIIVAFIVDLWIIANLVYYRANGFVLNVDAIIMVDNMTGFWSCLKTFFTNAEIGLLISSVVYGIELILLSCQVRNRHWTYFVIVNICLYLAVCLARYKNNEYSVHWLWSSRKNNQICELCKVAEPIINPLYEARWQGVLSYSDGPSAAWINRYIRNNSIVDYAYTSLAHAAYVKKYGKQFADKIYTIPFTKQDSLLINSIYVPNNQLVQPTSNLIVILFESLESWTLEDWLGCEQVCPNLRDIIEDRHTLYVEKLKSEAIQGASGDGQLNVLTGLLPLQIGAACRLYGENKYPNLAQFYQYSYTINPSPGTWNQRVVNASYGIDSLFEQVANDLFEVNNALMHINDDNQPFYELVITEASHSPFICKDMESLSFSSDMPTTMKDYLTTIHYTDSCLGVFFDGIKEKGLWDNTTIVITGDHTIFKDLYLREFQSFAEVNDISIKTGANYVPLIIHSPAIESFRKVGETCYQMDIFPTVKKIVGCENYGWQGLGVDLMDDNAICNRYLSEEQAYALSEKLIRNDYFQRIQNK